ncbi:MAG TPA: DUF5655 domain-containing protein [Blastocatellia bacterium]|nr:DUF5655 domain-containing protein [Blastocatellia bacterium]
MSTPASYSVADQFKTADPLVRTMYDRLLATLRKFGPVTESPKKTCIHLDNISGFAGVYVRKNYINLVLRTDYKIESPRIAKTEQISKNRFHHTLKLTSESEIDKELSQWLKDAYLLSK